MITGQLRAAGVFETLAVPSHGQNWGCGFIPETVLPDRLLSTAVWRAPAPSVLEQDQLLLNELAIVSSWDVTGHFQPGQLGP